MSKILNEDFINPEFIEKDEIPVRIGCLKGGGPCECDGSCDKIIGKISMSKYLDFLESYVSPEEWVNQNTIKL